MVARDGASGPEVLLLRRRRGGAFGGLWVFPGGRVEQPDFEAPVGLPGDPAGADGAEVAAARAAAVRETAEESALVLDPGTLAVHSYWLPPPEAPRRFSTWFFVAPAGSAVAVAVDRAEVHEHRWLTASAALAARDAGEIGLAPPTWVTLWQLRDLADVTSVIAEAKSRGPRRFLTHLVRASAPDGSVLLWEGDAAWADGDLRRPGPRRRLWVPDTGEWSAETPAGTPAGGAGGDR